MPKQKPLDFFDEQSRKGGKKVVSCFNEESTLSEDTKLVIIGTLTPPNTPYFYCSPENRLFGYVDEAAKECCKFNQSLKELKSSDDPKKVETIKGILGGYKIAFLDVMGKAIRKRITSEDNDIEYYCLADEKQFKEIPDGALIIANSRLAERCLKKILSRIDVKDLPEVIPEKGYWCLSQRRGKKDRWLKAIKSALSSS